MRSITLVAATSVLACLLISCAAISARKLDPHTNLLSNPRFLVGLQTVYVLIGILVSLRILFILSNSEAISFITNSGIANSSSIAGVFPGQPYSYMPPQPNSERQSAYPTPVPGSSGVPRFSSQLSSSERQSAYPTPVPGSSGVPRFSSQPSSSGICSAYTIPEAFEPSYVANPIRSLYPAQPVSSVRPPGYTIPPQSGHVKLVMPSYPAQLVGSVRSPGYAMPSQPNYVKLVIPPYPAQPVGSVRPPGYTIPSRSGHVKPVMPSYPAQPVGSVRTPGYAMPSQRNYVNPVIPPYPARPVGSVRPLGYAMPSQPNYVKPVIPPYLAQPVGSVRPPGYTIPSRSGHVNLVTPSYPAQSVGSVRSPGYAMPSQPNYVKPVIPPYPAQSVGSVRPPGYTIPSRSGHVKPVMPTYPAQPVDPARPLFYNIPAQSVSALSNDPGQPASATGPQVASLTVPVSLNQFVREHLDPRHNPVFDAKNICIQHSFFEPLDDFCELLAPICDCKNCLRTNSASASTACTASTQRECLKDIGLEKLPALVALKLNSNVSPNSPEAVASAPSHHVYDLQACLEFLRRKDLGTLEPELAHKLPAFIFHPDSAFSFGIKNDRSFRVGRQFLHRKWSDCIRDGLFELNQHNHQFYEFENTINLREPGWIKCVVYIDDNNHFRMLFIPVELLRGWFLHFSAIITLVPIDYRHVPSDNQKRDLVPNRFGRWCKLDFKIKNMQVLQGAHPQTYTDWTYNRRSKTGLTYRICTPSYLELLKRYLSKHNVWSNLSDLRYAFFDNKSGLTPGLLDYFNRPTLTINSAGYISPKVKENGIFNNDNAGRFGSYSPAANECRWLNFDPNGLGLVVPQEFFNLNPATLPPFLVFMQQFMLRDRSKEDILCETIDSSDPAGSYTIHQAFEEPYTFTSMNSHLQLASNYVPVDACLLPFKKNLEQYFSQKILFYLNKQPSSAIPVKPSLLSFKVPADLYLKSEDIKRNPFGDYHVVCGTGAALYDRAQLFYVLNGGKPACIYPVQSVQPEERRISPNWINNANDPVNRIGLANYNPNPTVLTPWGQLTVNGFSYSDLVSCA